MKKQRRIKKYFFFCFKLRKIKTLRLHCSKVVKCMRANQKEEIENMVVKTRVKNIVAKATTNN